MHILSETDNCPSWITRRETMTVENISWSISTKECCRHGCARTRIRLKSDAHPTDLPRPAGVYVELMNNKACTCTRGYRHSYKYCIWCSKFRSYTVIKIIFSVKFMFLFTIIKFLHALRYLRRKINLFPNHFASPWFCSACLGACY